MVRVGLTGGIASGKTVVSNRLQKLGALVIDADLLAREVVEPGTPGLAAIAERFPQVMRPDGALDRPALGAIVFADPEARRDLERIIHPAVRARAAQIEADAAPNSVVVHVIPLLVETGQVDDFDLVVVIDVEPEAQLARLHARDGLSVEEASARLTAQASREQRLAAADEVLRNDSSEADLEEDVDRLWTRIASFR